MPSAAPPLGDAKPPTRRSVQPTELIGAALSTNLTYRRLIRRRLRRELISAGPNGPQRLLRAVMRQLGGPLTERSKTLRKLLNEDPALMALLPGAARPPIFASRDGWRRQERRASVRWPVTYPIERCGSQVPCRILDISRRGAFVGCSRAALQHVVTETEVMLRIAANQSRLFNVAELTGFVRWTGFSVNHQERGFGVEFHKTATAIDIGLDG